MTTKISGVDELFDSAGAPISLGGGSVAEVDIDTWVPLGEFSGAAVASIDSTFWPAGIYEEIEVTWHDMATDDDATDLQIRVSLDGSTFDSGASDYRFNLQGFQSDGGAAFEIEGNGVDHIQVTENQGDLAGEESDGQVVFFSADDAATECRMVGHCSWTSSQPDFTQAVLGAKRDADGAIRGIQMLALAGNITGRFVVRGRRTLTVGGGVIDPVIEFRDWETLERIVLSGAVATVDFAVFDETLYDEYELSYLDVTGDSDGESLRLRTSTDGGSTYDAAASDYSYWLRRVTHATSPGEAENGDDLLGHSTFVVSMGDQAGEVVSGKLYFGDLGLAEIKAWWGQGTGRLANGLEETWWGGGSRLDSTAINSIQISPTAGNLDTGTFILRARRKAPISNAAFLTEHLLHVRDEKAANTAGGTFTQDAWQTRDLNTVATNEIPGASLASDQITLPAGTYEIHAWAPHYRTGRSKLRLFDTTGAADLIIGSHGHNNNTFSNTMDQDIIQGRFTLSVESVIELQHRSLTTQTTSGFGLAANIDSKVEVYAEVIIRTVTAQAVEVVVGTMYVEDQKAAGTDNTDMGSVDTWNTRTLNTEVINTITGASLASDVITLPAGTYRAKCIAPGYRIAFHKCRLRDTTNTLTLAVGTPERNHNGSTDGFITGHSLIQFSQFTLTAEADLELQHFCTVANGTTGGGLDNVGDAEIARYASVYIEKMST